MTLANGNTSHAEGYENLALGRGSHAEGMWNLAFGNWSHAEGGNIHQLRELQVTAAANSKSVKIIND